MWKKKDYSLEEIGVEGTYNIPSIRSISLTTLSRRNEDNEIIYTSNGAPRCSLRIESEVAHGSYGNLYLAKRCPYGTNEVQTVLVKQPRLAAMSLAQEGILQHISQLVLAKEGIAGAIPRIYDIFWNKKEVWFSMELIQGIRVIDFFSASVSPDLDFYLFMGQMSLLLWCLEHNLGLDHRDLKIDNILIRPEPITFNLKIKDHTWKLVCPFRIVLLDFGFACLGSDDENRTPLVNLGDGVLPPMDPCPKDGRDIFQLLTSLLTVPVFNEKISKAAHDRIDHWLSVGKKSYGSMARRWSTENWTYLVASQRNFSIPACCPENILHDIMPYLVGYLSFK